jgi:hypothetical protein
VSSAQGDVTRFEEQVVEVKLAQKEEAKKAEEAMTLAKRRLHKQMKQRAKRSGGCFGWGLFAWVAQ